MYAICAIQADEMIFSLEFHTTLKAHGPRLLKDHGPSKFRHAYHLYPAYSSKLILQKVVYSFCTVCGGHYRLSFTEWTRKTIRK